MTNEGKDGKMTFTDFIGLTETTAYSLAEDLLACVL